MKAMVLREARVVDPRAAVSLQDRQVPLPSAGDVRIRVHACGVCHTELDEIDGRTPPSALPRIPGHQVVGIVDAVGPDVPATWIGRRVGVGWIFRACGVCACCCSGRENLCPRFEATGRDADGGYAEFMVAPAGFVHALPEGIPAVELAPLLCAGAIGYRSLSLTGLQDGEPLGLTGFGASAHLVLAVARYMYPRSAIHVLTRNANERAFAMELGASWAGDIEDRPPSRLAAIIDTTPAWRPVVRALECLAPGGRLVINAIRKEAGDHGVLAEIDYARHLWQEKSIQSVANVTRDDVRRVLALAVEIPLRPVVRVYPLAKANEALAAVRRGGGRGAVVLKIGDE